MSRRRFVTLLAAGSAAVAARPALAAAAASPKRTKPAAPPAAKPAPATAAALQKEFDRQRAGTLDTLKTLRKFPLPPGGDLPVVFRPLRAARKGR
jgi:hypothetical protein